MNILYCSVFCLLAGPVSSSRSFEVDWENDRFLKDGAPFSYHSGGMHYFRVPHQYWRDRMYKMKLAGMNTLQTYVSWNSHEPQEGQYDWSGDNDLGAYLGLAQKMGLQVVFRPGPYICGEWRFGGLPYWLLNKPGIEFRKYSEPYVTAIAKWFSVLLPKIEPYLYRNGGPIITVQVENEYGAYGPNVCDKDYLEFLLEQLQKYLGRDVVYFTMDNSSVKRLACGALPGLLKALDFGPDRVPKYQLAMLRKFQEHGPFINGEFWAGWFDEWGGRHAHRGAAEVAGRLDEMLQLNASVNFYMFHGGTNFGYTNGAMSKHPGRYNVRVTSYDYNSPLSEAGDTTPKYFAIREVMSRYTTLPPDPIPANSTKWASPAPVPFTHKTPLFGNLDRFSAKCTSHPLPYTMERFNQSDGFILYELEWEGTLTEIELYGVHDRAAVYVDHTRIGTVNRMESLNGSVVVPHQLREGGVRVTILVENLGRVNHGSYMGIDYKGITIGVMFDGVEVNSRSWEVCSLPLDPSDIRRVAADYDVTTTTSYPHLSGSFTPTLFCGNFSSSNQHDSFLDPRGWGKGVAYFNYINLGRYWPGEGPQVTLYTPGVYFTGEDNMICVFEMEGSRPDNTIGFIDTPILDLHKSD